MTEQEKLVRAKKQLLIVGVVCTTLLIFVLWITHLKATLQYINRNATALPIESFKETGDQLGPQWKEFRKQLGSFNK